MKLSLNKGLPPDQLKALAAAARWKVEQSGCYLDGIPLRTDDISQSKVVGAIKLLEQQGTGATLDFKAPDGFVTLDLPHMLAISIAVGNHVQTCFSKEKEVTLAIDAGTIRTEAEVAAAFAAIPSPGLT